MSPIISVMTYNVHSCIGVDRRLSPLRIAEVIEHCNPDVVALQELDAGLARTEMVDQAHQIARTLEMSYHFHAAIQVEEGGYGNAILSRWPLSFVKAGALPTDPVHPHFERRGALWVETVVEGHRLQILATHFGLDRRERVLQADAILGPEWLGHPDCQPPMVLCGDFNSIPNSPPYRRLCRHLKDAQRGIRRSHPRGTFPVQLPLMRIDHLFVSNDIKARGISVPRTSLTRVASDHLPLVATLELP